MEDLSSPDTRCRACRDVLKNVGVSATFRLEKGHGIDDACGQSRLKKETEESIHRSRPRQIASTHFFAGSHAMRNVSSVT